MLFQISAIIPFSIKLTLKEIAPGIAGRKVCFGFLFVCLVWLFANCLLCFVFQIPQSSRNYLGIVGKKIYFSVLKMIFVAENGGAQLTG